MNYYAVERSTDHLAHYGVKGMRWGVRKAIATGNQALLAKHYRKAAKKLAKLQRIGDHPGRSTAKAAAYGTAAAGIGSIALGGTGLAANLVRKSAGGIRLAGLGLEKLGVNTMNKLGTPLSKRELSKISKLADKIENYGKGTTAVPVGIKYRTQSGGRWDRYTGRPGETPIPVGLKKHRVSNDKLVKLGAGAVALGLAAKSAQHAYRSRNAEKYREKAERFKNEMDNAFAGTDYEGHYERLRRRRRRYG